MQLNSLTSSNCLDIDQCIVLLVNAIQISMHYKDLKKSIRSRKKDYEKTQARNKQHCKTPYDPLRCHLKYYSPEFSIAISRHSFQIKGGAVPGERNHDQHKLP